MVETILSVAVSLWILIDPIGDVPLFIALLNKMPPERQKKIICREMLIGLSTMVLFLFIGDGVLRFLNIQPSSLSIAGGIILFLISIKMIFPLKRESPEDLDIETEPFIVPLAIPLVAGPSVLAAIMIYARQQEQNWAILASICIAWAISLAILLSAPFLHQALGKKGIKACERLMGLILTLMATQMFLSGLSLFVQQDCSPSATVNGAASTKL
jgi:MarC family membrane protein